MPIHEFGYRHWDGARTPRIQRWYVLTRTGIALALRTRVVKRLALFAVVPALYFAVVFFAIGQFTDPNNPDVSPIWQGFVRGIIEDPVMLSQLRNDPSVIRTAIWNDIFLMQSRAQLFMALFVTTFVAPALISRDRHSKAFLIYFSKPIARTDYLAGKAGVIGGYIAWFTLVPSTLIYIVSIATSPSGDTFAQTASVIPSIIGAGLVTILPITAISLFISSLTSIERVAMFAWIVTVLGGEFASGIRFLPAFEDQDWPMLLSLRMSVQSAADGMFADPTLRFDESGPPGLALGWLTFLTIACTYGVWQRISAPLRV